MKSMKEDKNNVDEKYRDTGRPTLSRSVLLRGTQHLNCKPDLAQELDTQAALERYSTGIAHSAPFTEILHH
ncbi:MAG: hypothetical protein LUQ38_05230 [Methanotrichaceae archaeon]|nr:hypothetical protein [Methanotrichaceae archaeon]